ncbi:hypothetical protein [Brumicola nitratireducens]|uniref:hypothetical protein n=1 Tax=Brumicola nitratireducens TaxID=300231 RepID=UPI00059DA74B|nr:hypothetical protein [Glaciecola nitratireducens]
MATYFFVVISLIIVALLAFALCESKGRNSPKARGKFANAKHSIETSSPPASRAVEYTRAQSNH